MRRAQDAEHVSDGTFHARQLLPGRVDLRIQVSGVSKPLLVLEGITLLPGEPARDDRLLSIDLTGRVPR